MTGTRQITTMAVLAALTLGATTLAQEIDTGRETKHEFIEPGVDNMHIYQFFSIGGPTIGTLVWDNPEANLGLILVCGDVEPLTFASSAGLVDRVTRFETGVPPLQNCFVSVVSFDTAATYWFNMRDSSDSLITRQSDRAALRPFQDGDLRVVEALRDAAGALARAARLP